MYLDPFPGVATAMLSEIFQSFQVLLTVVPIMSVCGFRMTVLSPVSAPFMDRGPQLQLRRVERISE